MTPTSARIAHTGLRWLLVALCVGAGRPCAVSAQDAEIPGESIELSGDLELSRLIELVSQRLGVSVQYVAGDVNKRVTLRLRGPVSNEDLWRILSAALESQQLAIVRTEQPGLFRVLPMQQAAAQPAELRTAQRSDGPSGEPGASFTSTIVQLRSADPAEIAAALAPAMTPQVGQVKPIGSGGLLLISDLRQRVDLALALIERLDGPADPAVRFTVDLAQASAAETAALAQQALAARLAASGQRSTAVIPSGTAGAAALTGAQFIALPDDRRLMVIAAGSREQELRALIAELDVREALETRSYSAPGIDPKDLAETIKGLLETRAAEAAKPQSTPTRVAADRLSGAVLVTARARDHARIGELIERIVAAPPSSRRTLQSFVVKNRSASELMATLQQLLGSDPGALSSVSAEGAHAALTTTGNRSGVAAPTSPLETSPPSGAAAAGTSPQAGGARSGPASGLPGVPGVPGVTVDESTNTILAVGDPTSLAQLGALIAALDKRQPQVMIEVSLVSLSESQAIDFGVELRTQFERGGTTFNLSSLFGLGTGTALPTGVGFTGVAINPGDFEVVVRALESIDAGRSASTPKVLVNNSQTASLRAVLRQPFTSLNASDTVAT
ncbi:MAG: hypothetical protein IBJ10_07820, partial [Phycisphaerales bacterium]|nr:hypothetical protein [Phycisphaerales bacterium]